MFILTVKKFNFLIDIEGLSLGCFARKPYRLGKSAWGHLFFNSSRKAAASAGDIRVRPVKP
jgi:hypothetical protein